MGDLAFFASVRPVAARAAGHAWLTGVTPIDPAWKTHRDILAGNIPSWAVRHEGKDEIVAVHVVFHADAPAGVLAPQLLKRHNADLIGVIGSINAVVAHVPRAALGALILEDDVQWVEPVLPPLQEMNAENRVLTQANIAQSIPYSLNGAGVTVFVFDGGSVRFTHQDFGGRATVIDGSGMSSHATHCAGSVGGSGAASGGNNRGMAPGVTILSAGVNISGQSGWLYSNPVDIEADYTTAHALGAHLATNSIGTNVASNGFPCDWHGDYHTTDAVIDAIVRAIRSSPASSPSASSGRRQRTRQRRCGTSTAMGPSGSRTTSPSAGQLQQRPRLLLLQLGAHRRRALKPDFSAPGCQSGGDGRVTSTTSQRPPTALCGTSMPAHRRRLRALLLQDFRPVPLPGRPRNSTLKALFAQSARDRGNPGPDYQYGYGSVRVRDTIDLMRTGNFQEAEVAQGQDQYRSLRPRRPPPSSSPSPGTIRPPPQRRPRHQRHRPRGLRADSGPRLPWTLDPANPGENAVRTQRNTRDNLEQVFVDNPTPGVWNVRVSAFNVPIGPQSFSIVSSHTLAGGQPIPTISMVAADLVSLVPPGTPTPVSADIFIRNDEIVPGSPRVWYRTAPGASFTGVPMSHEGGTRWVGLLTGFACDASVEYYFTAAGALAGTATLPAAAPGTAYATGVGVVETYYAFDMEADDGWVGGQPGDTATTGQWNRMDPEGTAAQPEDTPPRAVACWVTDGRRAPASPSTSTAGSPPSSAPRTSSGSKTPPSPTALTQHRHNAPTTDVSPSRSPTTAPPGSPSDHQPLCPAPAAGGSSHLPRRRLPAQPRAQRPPPLIADDAEPGSIVGPPSTSSAGLHAPACDRPRATAASTRTTSPPRGSSRASSCSDADPDFNRDGNVDQDDIDGSPRSSPAPARKDGAIRDPTSPHPLNTHARARAGAQAHPPARPMPSAQCLPPWGGAFQAPRAHVTTHARTLRHARAASCLILMSSRRARSRWSRRPGRRHARACTATPRVREQPAQFENAVVSDEPAPAAPASPGVPYRSEPWRVALRARPPPGPPRPAAMARNQRSMPLASGGRRGCRWPTACAWACRSTTRRSHARLRGAWTRGRSSASATRRGAAPAPAAPRPGVLRRRCILGANPPARATPGGRHGVVPARVERDALEIEARTEAKR